MDGTVFSLSPKSIFRKSDTDRAENIVNNTLSTTNKPYSAHCAPYGFICFSVKFPLILTSYIRYSYGV